MSLCLSPSTHSHPLHVMTARLLLLLVSAYLSHSFECDYYLAPSKYVGSGVGVFAGRHFAKEDIIVNEVIVAFRRTNNSIAFQLQDYVYDGYRRKDEKIFEFGPCMIFNHHVRNHVGHLEYDEVNEVIHQIDSLQALSSHTIYPNTYFSVFREVVPGQEMFNFYSDGWFEDRNITDRQDEDSSIMHYDLAELKQVGHCLTKVFVDQSDIPGAGLGVFAGVAMAAGELVQVTPVLLIAKHEAKEMSDSGNSVLINYCVSHPDSDVSFIPLGYVGVCNHGADAANMVIEWFFWSEEGRSVLEQDARYVHDKLPGSLYFAYRATRDIAAGEELLIDYGEAWQLAWDEHQLQMSVLERFEGELPLFRRAIDAPEGLFPEHWLVECVGLLNCPYSEQEAKDEL